MPLRDDFDVEHQNDAELLLSDMQFNDDDHERERQLKIQIVQIYNRRLDERERRKKVQVIVFTSMRTTLLIRFFFQFVIERGLLDYRKQQALERRKPKDEREIYNIMRVFARFHSPEQHEAYMQVRLLS